MRKCLRTLLSRSRLLPPAIGFVAVLIALSGAPGSATAGGGGSGGGQTVKVTLNIPALVLDNLCNGDVVNLSGDLHITTTTTPRRNGGYTVRSSAYAYNLRGSRIAPLPPIGYRGQDAEDTYSYYAPPPQPSQHRVVHWTKLVPDGKAPTMWLVLVLQETVLADGTVVPVFERAYLQCKRPKEKERGKHGRGKG